MKLPVDDILPDLIAQLRDRTTAILVAPPGSGKTSRVPLALERAFPDGGHTLVLEPRRVAARSAAAWMAEQRGESLGESVGYVVRFDRKVGPRTRVRVVTEGVLLRMLDQDPMLESISQVIFDEFHERRLQADVALAMVRQVQEVRDDLRVVVMSATMDPEPVARFLDAPVLRAEGRVYPVEVALAPLPISDPIAAAPGAIAEAYTQTDGHVLAFLPGVREISDTVAEVTRLLPHVPVLPLHGSLKPSEQDAAIAPSRQRKIVVATNIAETSVTIDGVTAVVDTGLEKAMRYDAAVGLNRLELVPISRASADQRAGRAGRTRAGRCVRLWAERDHARRPAFAMPEMHRLDLADIALRLHAWGERDLSAFPFFDPPPAASLDRATTLLSQLGAVQDGRITEVGREMVALPVSPRLARLLVAGHRLGITKATAWAAVLLSEGDLFRDDLRGGRASSGCDIQDRVDRLDRAHDVPWRYRQAHKQMVQATRRACPHGAAGRARLPDAARPLSAALLSGFPDRVARRRRAGEREAVMVGGHGVTLARASGVRDAAFFVVLDARAGRRDLATSIAALATPIPVVALDPARITSTELAAFDPGSRAVKGVRVTRYGDLELERVTCSVAPALVAEALAAAAAKQLDAALDLQAPKPRRLRARMQCVAAWRPDLGLPDVSDEGLQSFLPQWCMGKRSFAQLRKFDIHGALLGTLTYPQRQTLDRLAPEAITVPSGSSIKLEYEVGKAPVLAVRIQEVFGLSTTPTVAGGRVRVVMHLLAPNMRPQQVTDDLASFWARGYPEVRKDLRARYAKHAWPEDPINAKAMRGAKRRRRS